MEQRVFWYVYDPLEDRWYYPPDPLNQSLLRSECIRWRGTSIYGYRPRLGLPGRPQPPHEATARSPSAEARRNHDLQGFSRITNHGTRNTACKVFTKN